MAPLGAFVLNPAAVRALTLSLLLVLSSAEAAKAKNPTSRALTPSCPTKVVQSRTFDFSQEGSLRLLADLVKRGHTYSPEFAEYLLQILSQIAYEETPPWDSYLRQTGSQHGFAWHPVENVFSRASSDLQRFAKQNDPDLYFRWFEAISRPEALALFATTDNYAYHLVGDWFWIAKDCIQNACPNRRVPSPLAVRDLVLNLIRHQGKIALQAWQEAKIDSPNQAAYANLARIFIRLTLDASENAIENLESLIEEFGADRPHKPAQLLLGYDGPAAKNPKAPKPLDATALRTLLVKIKNQFKQLQKQIAPINQAISSNYYRLLDQKGFKNPFD